MRARRLPSFQLAGYPDRAHDRPQRAHRHRRAARRRLAGVSDEGKAQFSGSLRNQCALADLKLGRLLDTIDEWASANGLDGEIDPPHRFEPTASRTIRRSSST